MDPKMYKKKEKKHLMRENGVKLNHLVPPPPPNNNNKKLLMIMESKEAFNS